MTDVPLKILYQNDNVLVVQTQAGHFDKFAKDDIYGEFNMGLHVGDCPKRVLSNRAKLLSALNRLSDDKVQSIHWLNQVHSDIVLDIDDSQASTTPQTADALMTCQSGQALAIMTADCVPIAVFGGGVVACIHAGWQGLTNGIIQRTLDNFPVNTSLTAVMGACISQVNYEIDKTLARRIVDQVQLHHLVDMTGSELYQAIIQDKENDKCLIDIVKLAKLQLEKSSVAVMIDDVPCSYAAANLYSYRAQTHAKKSATGRMATVIVQF